MKRRFARALFEDCSVVAVASDGTEALAREPFDLLLADIKMPVMDGRRSRRRDDPTLIVLLMGGHADLRERSCGLHALIQAVLTKPFWLDELRRAVSGAPAGARPAMGY